MEHVPRERNQERIGCPNWLRQSGTIPDSTPVKWVEKEAFWMKEVMDTTPEGKGKMPEPWYQVILNFLRTRVLPEDPLVANNIQRQSLYPTRWGTLAEILQGSVVEVYRLGGRVVGY
ncbi:hypothetical protein LIER_36418 [Lithospermum erythrorhizon]|uniref:Uncharacterized protein n=1 Tax=Lithospermum erythrorhizon TaxID=34254 RepID=A0AAV3P6X2_LITER